MWLKNLIIQSAHNEKQCPYFHLSSSQMLVPEDNHSWLSLILVLLEVISIPLNNVHIVGTWFVSFRPLLGPALKGDDIDHIWWSRYETPCPSSVISAKSWRWWLCQDGKLSQDGCSGTVGTSFRFANMKVVAQGGSGETQDWTPRMAFLLLEQGLGFQRG